jgi:hypothetical protein
MSGSSTAPYFVLRACRELGPPLEGDPSLKFIIRHVLEELEDVVAFLEDLLLLPGGIEALQEELDSAQVTVEGLLEGRGVDEGEGSGEEFLHLMVQPPTGVFICQQPVDCSAGEFRAASEVGDARVGWIFRKSLGQRFVGGGGSEGRGSWG